MKTPGGKLVYQHMKKMTSIPKCGDCKIKLSGVSQCGVVVVVWFG